MEVCWSVPAGATVCAKIVSCRGAGLALGTRERSGAQGCGGEGGVMAAERGVFQEDGSSQHC